MTTFLTPLAIAIASVALAVACSTTSAGGACPAFTAACITGEVPTDTDGDGCVDACRPGAGAGADAAASDHDGATASDGATPDGAAHDGGLDAASPSPFCQSQLAHDALCKPTATCNTASLCTAEQGLFNPDAVAAIVSCTATAGCDSAAASRCAFAYLADKPRSATQQSFAAAYCTACPGGPNTASDCTARLLHPAADAGTQDVLGAGPFLTLELSDATLATIMTDCIPLAGAATDAGAASGDCDNALGKCIAMHFASVVPSCTP